MALARMRIAADIIAEIRRLDPETRITPFYIKELIHHERVPVLIIGRKKLADLDAVLAYISTNGSQLSPEVEPQCAAGEVRPVQL